MCSCLSARHVPQSWFGFPMIAAYVFHAANIAASILLVPLLLRHLESSEYALWLLFTVFGGVTLHIQNAIQNASVKEIARSIHIHDELVQALQRMRSAYAGLTLFVAFPFLGFGLIYLRLIGFEDYALEWCIFIMSYAMVYAFAPNFAVLLGTDRVAKCNNINTLTRVLYLFAVAAFLKLGLSILGLCISFALTSLVGILLSSYATKKDSNPPWKWSLNPNITRYACFAVVAFALYNGSLLIAATMFSKETIAAYGLGLQVCLLLVTLSLAPLQVWLARLVRAIALGDEKKELLRNLAVINFIYISGALFLLVFGNNLLVFIGSGVPLPDRLNLILLAFAVELNLAVLINFLMTKGNYRFVQVYVLISLTGLCFGTVIAYITDNIYSFIAVPLCLQAILCLPWIVRIAFAELSLRPTSLLDTKKAPTPK